jgi:hypothetical protein
MTFMKVNEDQGQYSWTILPTKICPEIKEFFFGYKMYNFCKFNVNWSVAVRLKGVTSRNLFISTHQFEAMVSLTPGRAQDQPGKLPG